MSSRGLYDKIHTESISRISSNDVQVDEYLSPRTKDNRMGISLIIPITDIERNYRRLISELTSIEPGLFLYPFPDLHITIFDFLRGSGLYRRDQEIENRFSKICSKIQQCPPIEVVLCGIVFSPAAGLIQGFDNNRLIEIRELIRASMIEEGMKNDERYRSESAHITFARFRNRLENPGALCSFIEKNRDREFGEITLSRFELVEHDWYNRESQKRIIKEISL
jgi:hypothetical protein